MATIQHQRRFLPRDLAGVRAEARASSKGKRWIVGHASVFNQWTELYRNKSFVIRERVRPGAYTNALAEGQDVRALFNHSSDYVLGRTHSGTLLLSQDSMGLFSEINHPDTQLVRDMVLTPMERGDISGMSFAFMPRSGGYKLTEYERDGLYHFDYELTDADLFDVSVVTNPAYAGTDVGLRSASTPLEAARGLGLPEPSAIRSVRHPRRSELERWLRVAELEV